MKCDCCGTEFKHRPIAVTIWGKTYHFCSALCALLHGFLAH